MSAYTQNKLNDLLSIEGLDQNGFLEKYGNDDVVPGICMVSGCYYTVNYEPDSRSGWCDECETNTVQSGLVLIGIL